MEDAALSDVTLSWVAYFFNVKKDSINFHCCADDTQLYLSIKQDDTNQLVERKGCLNDIKTSTACNFRQLNSDKTEVLVLGP